jgi:hypothetical protein
MMRLAQGLGRFDTVIGKRAGQIRIDGDRRDDLFFQ